VIWLLLGLLLFGGSSRDLGRPGARAAVFQEEVESTVDDPRRRAAAQDVADRMAEVGKSVDPVAAALERRVHELDADPRFREADYRVALESALDQIDAAEQRLLELRNELRTTMTPEEWKELLAKVQVD
jgi:hypothetical protein